MEGVPYTSGLLLNKGKRDWSKTKSNKQIKKIDRPERGRGGGGGTCAETDAPTLGGQYTEGSPCFVCVCFNANEQTWQRDTEALLRYTGTSGAATTHQVYLVHIHSNGSTIGVSIFAFRQRIIGY